MFVPTLIETQLVKVWAVTGGGGGTGDRVLVYHDQAWSWVGGCGEGQTIGCRSTYLGVARGDQGGGALLQQIGEIAVGGEEIGVVAGEAVAGGGAPPPSAVLLEIEREGRGYCAAGL